MASPSAGRPLASDGNAIVWRCWQAARALSRRRTAMFDKERASETKLRLFLAAGARIG